MEFCCAQPYEPAGLPVVGCGGILNIIPGRWDQYMCAELAAGERDGSSSPCDQPELRAVDWGMTHVAAPRADIKLGGRSVLRH